MPDRLRRASFLSARALHAVRQVLPFGELLTGCALASDVGVLPAENRADPEEASLPESLRDALAERLCAEVPRVVIEDVAHGPVEALVLTASGLGAEAADLLRIVHGGARDVAAVGLEAGVHPAAVAAPAPVGGLCP